LWDPKANKVVINKDVVFDENAMLKNTQEKEQQEPKNSSSDKQVVEVE
jgi:ADP-glucose pyrophosphorylase